MPRNLSIDLGIQDIKVTRPKGAPGAPGAIGYSADIGQKTTGDITLGEKKVRVISSKTAPIRLIPGNGGKGRSGRGQQSPPPRPPRPWLRSKKVGKVFHTRIKGGELLSRRPLGKRRQA